MVTAEKVPTKVSETVDGIQPPKEVVEVPKQDSKEAIDRVTFEVRAKSRYVTLTDTSDREIVAEIVAVSADNLTVVRKTEARELSIPLELLSQNDRLFAEYLFEQQGKVSLIEFDPDVIVDSVAGLAEFAAKSGNKVKMKPGVYEMEDYLTPSVIRYSVPHPILDSGLMIHFSGSNNTFDLTGVTIEVDSKLLTAFGRRRVSEFYVSGNDNVIQGLTVTDIGNFPTAKGGQSFVVDGEDNTLKSITLNVSGSAPYGYGDLLGKGGGSLVSLQKHSAFLVTGLNIKVLDSSIYSKSFGHLFYVQGGRNVHFENCYAEAVTRTTDEMLAERSGPAYEKDFATVYGNYDGKKEIVRGYTKSLSECGFRNYGSGGAGQHATGAITMVNCRTKDTRVGFAMTRIDGDILIQDCEAVGCEVGYNLDGVTVENSRGDAVNGPLLYVNAGYKSIIDLALMPEGNTTKVHAVATIAGDDHEITLRKWNDMTRVKVHPILIGVSRPSACNPFSPLGMNRNASGITLNNYTEMPVKIESSVRSSKITSNSSVADRGSGNKIERVRGMSSRF